MIVMGVEIQLLVGDGKYIIFLDPQLVLVLVFETNKRMKVGNLQQLEVYSKDHAMVVLANSLLPLP
jgi:hypothetical protein